MMRFNVSPTQFISHSSTAWRGITYKRKQRVGWLANTGYDRFLPVRQMAPRRVHVTSKFGGHETWICLQLSSSVNLHYEIIWASPLVSVGGGGCARHERRFLSSPVSRFINQLSTRLKSTLALDYEYWIVNYCTSYIHAHKHIKHRSHCFDCRIFDK